MLVGGGGGHKRYWVVLTRETEVLAILKRGVGDWGVGVGVGAQIVPPFKREAGGGE